MRSKEYVSVTSRRLSRPGTWLAYHETLFDPGGGRRAGGAPRAREGAHPPRPYRFPGNVRRAGLRAAHLPAGRRDPDGSADAQHVGADAVSPDPVAMAAAGEPGRHHEW